MDKTINIYPQYTYHDDARIIGDFVGLITLRNTISAALDCMDGRDCAIDVYTSDGEGYSISVKRIDDEPFPDPHYGFIDAHTE